MAMLSEQPGSTADNSVAGDPDEKTMHIPQVPTRRQHALGIALVLSVACIWVLSAELIQDIFHNSFDAPFFLTYYSISLFSLCLLGFCGPSWRATFSPHNPYQPLTDLSPTATIQSREHAPENPPPAHRAIRLAAILAPIFFLSNWTFNVGLHSTSVASSSTIASLTAFFTLVIGRVCGVETFSFVKLIATAVVIAGVALISRNDESTDEDRLSGDLISILSAAIYSLYTIVLKLNTRGHDAKMPMMMMLAFMGFFTAITMWPAFFLVQLLGWEQFNMPSWHAFAMLTVNGLIGTVLSDFLMAKGVVLVTPLISTLALSLSVPLSIIVDVIWKKERFGWVFLVGATLVFAGFIMVNMDEASRRRGVTNEQRVPVVEDGQQDGMRLQETAVR